ncbi:hybrid sensor histidine kinase/response regulator [Acidovorax sp. A1169]|uniref:ATP-binding response regulator n=1 Tax=Acidovorax sp. A1169 TaxID=3059524 RepID=UPI002737B370|nr:hybrid sensor histidine kinase/response regulator [Acidovorax sp. A1169]MDP4073137.1 hybrid sensor histidine kinase/response regulator [Acidovorax sp. A1169]
MAATPGAPPDAQALDTLHRGAPLSAVVGVVEAFFLSVLFWREVPATAIALWLAAFAAVRCLRIGLGMAYRRSAGTRSARPAIWARWVVVSALAQALAWGVGSWVLWAPANLVAEMALHIGLAAVVLGSVAHLAHHLPALGAYAVGVFGPLAARDLLVGEPLHTLLALASVLMALYVWHAGRAQARAIAQAAAQQRERQELIAALQRENQATRLARQEAEAAHASKAQFLAAVGHDLRQPLNAMQLLAYTLQQPASSERVDYLAATLMECAESMGSLVEGLLELSRLDARSITPRPTRFALQALFDEMAGTFGVQAQAKGLAFTVEPTTAHVEGDRALLARVLSNLVANAIRYTPAGFVRLGGREQGAMVEVCVHDSGVGIDAAELPRIFDEHYQIGHPERDRSQGLGLGLATARRLCDLLGLELSVQSQPGQGSRFALCLPLAAPEPVAAGAAVTTMGDEKATAQPGPPAQRVLVLEDDAGSRRALTEVLQGWGCEVIAAASLQEAMQPQHARPDALVVDWHLPHGVQGPEAVAALRSAFGHAVPALLVTAEATPELQARAAAAGLPLLPKPIAPMKLRAFLQSQPTV